MNKQIKVLDQGYIQLIETWGSDERIIESARMSTQKGFLGWGPDDACLQCNGAGRAPIKVTVWDEEPTKEAVGPTSFRFVGGKSHEERIEETCPQCGGEGKKPGDEKLLKYLWDNSHATPFEMAGMTIEVKAPIMVFREWHRHRVPFGYNELSGRYIQIPDENYVPSVERLLISSKTNNKQAGTAAGAGVLDEAGAIAWRKDLQAAYEHIQDVYEMGLALGVPKELARLPVPVARYSIMRATGNLRGWLGFLALRCDPAAQWEIRQFANEVAGFVKTAFPRTYLVARDSVRMP